MNIVKNPVFIGVITGVVVYLYLKYQLDEKNKRLIKKKKKIAEEDVNLMIPLVVGALAWFFSMNYFEDEIEQEINDIPITISKNAEINEFNNELKRIVESLSDSAESYQILGKGLNIPNKLPDVFIETI